MSRINTLYSAPIQNKFKKTIRTHSRCTQCNKQLFEKVVENKVCYPCLSKLHTSEKQPSFNSTSLFIDIKI